MTFDAAVTSILLYLSNQCRGIDYRHFCVGRTNDIETCLFERHNVSKDKGKYATLSIDIPEMAEAVVQHFHALGMERIFENADINATMVYCYLVTTDTKE